MKQIPLTQGKFALVDDEDFGYFNQWKWYALKQPHTFYACRDVRIKGKRRTVWMHRAINKTLFGKLTDHKNGNGLDNRRKNLRSVTHQDNMLNCARWKIGSSKFRGVSWHISNKCWMSQITVDSKNIYIGSFKTEAEAKEAYDQKRNQVRKNKIIRKD